MTKRKFFDIILVYNEYALVEQRIKLFENKVDKFVIYDFGSGCKNYCSNQVYHIKASRSFLGEDFDLYYETMKILDHKKLYMEDVFIFSKANEIPDIDYLIEHPGIFDIKPVIFKQKKVFWLKNMFSPKVHFSSHAFTYSQFFTEKNLQEYFTSLVHPIPVNTYTINCGWQLNGFQDEISLVQALNFWGEQKVSEEIVSQSKSNLTDFDGNLLLKQRSDLPEEFYELESQVEISKAKNVFITEDLDYFSSREGFKILVSVGKIIDSNDKIHVFEIPKVPTYLVENFELSYSKNELLKFLKSLNLLPHDSIVLHKKETLDETLLTYQEFLNFVPSELF